MGDLELEKLEQIWIDENAKPTPLSYQLLERITNNFSTDRVIGCGGFGIVYKVRLNFLGSYFQKLLEPVKRAPWRYF